MCFRSLFSDPEHAPYTMESNFLIYVLVPDKDFADDVHRCWSTMEIRLGTPSNGRVSSEKRPTLSTDCPCLIITLKRSLNAAKLLGKKIISSVRLIGEVIRGRKREITFF